MSQPTIIEFSYKKVGFAGEPWHRVVNARGNAADRYQLYMCDALSMLVHSQSDCDELLELLDAVATNKREETIHGLNDTVITFRKTGVQMDILIDDELIDSPAGRFSLEECRKVLCAWQEFFLIPEGQHSRLFVELP